MASHSPLHVQLWLLNWGLGAGKAAFTVPLYTVMIISNNIIQGGLLFDEFTCLAETTWKLAVFIVALFVVLVGVAALAAQQGKASDIADASGRTTEPSRQPVAVFTSFAAASTEHATADMFGDSWRARSPVSRRSRLFYPPDDPDSPQNKASSHFEERKSLLQQILADRAEARGGVQLDEGAVEVEVMAAATRYASSGERQAPDGGGADDDDAKSDMLLVA